MVTLNPCALRRLRTNEAGVAQVISVDLVRPLPPVTIPPRRPRQSKKGQMCNFIAVDSQFKRGFGGILGRQFRAKDQNSFAPPSVSPLATPHVIASRHGFPSGPNIVGYHISSSDIIAQIFNRRSSGYLKQWQLPALGYIRRVKHYCGISLPRSIAFPMNSEPTISPLSI